MIDLTPLDVRNKRGDFKKLMRGYDPQEVDVFLELVAERLEALVRENIQLRDRTSTLQEQVEAQAGREQAVQDALVTAQELRKDIREQSQREAEHIMREAESEARRMIAEAEAEVRTRLRGVERQMDQSHDSLQELERRRQRFLQEFRGLLQRELDVVQVEEERRPLEDRTVDLDLGGRRSRSSSASDAGSSGATPASASAATSAAGSDATAAPSGTTSAAAGSADGEPSSAVKDVGADGQGGAAPEPSVGDEEGPLADDLGELAQRDEPAADTVADAAGSRAGDAASTADTAVDVADLQPEATTSGRKRKGGSPLADGPSSLELELMAGVGGDDAPSAKSSYPEVPDLETVLAEAGIDEVHPPAGEEISPPPAGQKPVGDDSHSPEDRLALFDKDDKGKKG